MRHHFSLTRQFHILLVLLALALSPSPVAAKLVIAQGGASGYIMGNSLPALTLAVAMEADIIKIDVVLSADNTVLVLADPAIETLSNVVDIFPDRSREDGHYYAFDFTLAEIRTLSLRDPAKRFAGDSALSFRISTLAEELHLLRTLTKSLGKEIHIAIELRKPWLHRKEGKDLTLQVLETLQQNGYPETSAPLSLLSYDSMELRRLKKTLLPEMKMSLQLMQLLEGNQGQEAMVEEWGKWSSYNYDWMLSKSGLRALSGYVSAIGLPQQMLVTPQGQLLLPEFIKNAHQLDTMIFTFSSPSAGEDLPPFVSSLNEELEFFYFTVGVDAIVTDFCGDASNYLRDRTQSPVSATGASQTLPPSSGLTINDPLQLTRPTGHPEKE